MSFLQPYVAGLMTDDFINVLLIFGREEARLAVLPSIKDTLFNASEANKQEIVDRCFGMSQNRQKARAILESVPSRYMPLPLFTRLHPHPLLFLSHRV
jgi:hypothetical protein